MDFQRFDYPMKTRRKLNVHEMFRRRSGCPVSMGLPALDQVRGVFRTL